MNFPEYLRSVGLNLNEIRGWETRQSSSKGFAPVGIMWHHTAGTNSLQLCIDKALVQFHISKTGVVSLISNGRTGHTGVGSGVVLKETQQGIAPYADARVRKLTDDTYGYRFYYGIEVENLGVASDPYPDVQIEALLLLTAALCELKGWPAEVVVHHREWTKRKIDMQIREFFGMSTLEATRYAIAQVRNIEYSPPAPADFPNIEELSGLSYRFPGEVLGSPDKGDLVAAFQEFLVAMGESIVVDGDFGPATTRATMNVQRLLDIKADGLWGEYSSSATDRFFALLHADEAARLAEEAEAARVAAVKAAEEQATLEAAQREAEALDAAEKAAEAAREAEDLANAVDQGGRAKEREVTLDNAKAEVDAMPDVTFENPPESQEGERTTEDNLGVLGWLVKAIVEFFSKTLGR